MAAQPQRKRNQLRRTPLVVDTTTALDLSNVKPHLTLKAPGKAVWNLYVANMPFWWTAADIATFAQYCAATDDLEAARKSGSTGTPLSVLHNQVRQLAIELGLTPASRQRLKLTEAQSAIAAKKVEALEAKQRKTRKGPIAVDELVDDG